MEKCDNTLDKLFKDINCKDCDFSKIKFILNGKLVNDVNKIMLMLLQQITSTLEILKTEYDFNHGDLKGGNFFYKIDDSYLKVDYPLNVYEYTIKGGRNKRFLCKTNIRVKIADYGKSSITFRKTHYYCNDTKLNLHKLSQIYYTPQKVSLESLTKDGKYLFDTDTPHGIEISLRHLACPYFLSADYYILITSLCLTSNNFYDFVSSYKILETLELDISEELSKEIFRKRPESVVTAFDLLRGKYFKCTAISDVSKLILSYF
jgi:archaellum component FlaF (FlaF/FlaG flagellin family)